MFRKTVLTEGQQRRLEALKQAKKILQTSGPDPEDEEIMSTAEFILAGDPLEENFHEKGKLDE